MFDINYESGLGKEVTAQAGIGGDVSIGVGHLVSVCTDVYVQVGRIEEKSV